MISKKQVDAILKDKMKLDFKNETFSDFSKSYEILGKLLVGKLPKYRDTTPIINFYEEAFGKDYKTSPWASDEGLKLAQLLFGKQRAPYIQNMWALLLQLPFQSGYNRRPFRMAVNSQHITKAINQLRSFVNTSYYGFADCNLTEQAQLTGYYQNMGNAYFLLWF